MGTSRFSNTNSTVDESLFCDTSFTVDTRTFNNRKSRVGEEKSNQELEMKYKNKIKQLTQEKDKIIKSITQKHESYLKRRSRDVYAKGNCVYILSHEAFTDKYGVYFKDMLLL